MIIEIFDFSHEYFTMLLFGGEYGNVTEKVFLSSNNHSGIIICLFPLSKLQIVLFINFNGNPVF